MTAKSNPTASARIASSTSWVGPVCSHISVYPKLVTKILLSRQQPLLLDHRYRQRLVPEVVEEHRHLVALVAQDRSDAPLRMGDPAVHRVRAAGRHVVRRARQAIVTVPARLFQMLAEVRQQRLSPAARGL